MAKIKNANPKQNSGGYKRLVGNEKLADIFTRAQSTIISNGTELEKIISNKAVLIKDLEKFIDDCDSGIITNGSYLCTKKVIKASKYRLEKHEPDFVVFTVDTAKKICYVVELKDGDSFDTKKSTAEKQMLKAFVNHLAPLIPFRIKYYICCFNQPDKAKIITGFKNAFEADEVMTGEEFCKILDISYSEILEMRKSDTIDNFEYVVEKISEIDEVQTAVISKQREHIQQNEFYGNNDEE